MNKAKRALSVISVFVISTAIGLGFITLTLVGSGKAYEEIEPGDRVSPGPSSQIDHLPVLPNPRHQDEAQAATEDISVSEPLTVVITQPPVASLISIGVANAFDVRTISGAAGSVEPGAIVAVGNLDTSVVTFVNAEPEGSFQARIYAPPGSSIQVKHAYPFISLNEIEATFTGTIAGDIIAGWMNATAGTIIQVPLTHSGQIGSIPFGFAGTIAHESGEGFWYMQGISGPEIPFGAGIQLPITATVQITTPALIPGMDLSGTTGIVEIKLRRIFDEDGNQIPMSQTPISNFLTPTGLPISRGTPNWSSVEILESLIGWQQAPDSTLTAILSATLSIPEAIPPGYYLPRIDLRFTGIPLGPSNNRTFRPAIFFDSPTTGYLPIAKIGDPAPPRLVWSLMTDTLFQGSRGTFAREDKARVGLIPLTVFQPDKFILPKDDPRTGEPIPYSLEPFLPLISMTDRGTPNPPLIPFTLPGGELQVAVEKPDGTIEHLGPAPFLQSMNRTPAFPDGKVRDNDGGALQDIYQLITLNDEFQYTFDQYGHHLILMNGFVEDVWGNTYQVSNTFDVYIARPLKLESGQLPTTPYELDNVFSPGVHVYPPVPADVEIHLIHFPNSVPPAITHTITGVANPFGYFHPPSPPIFMQPPGEFRVDISAVYDAPDGTLWMGNMTWGGIVEDPGAFQIIAHGRRGLDIPDANPPLWFFHYLLGFDGVAHTNYPYYSGDIFWGIEVQTPTRAGADAILPVITVEDNVGDVYTLIQQRWSNPHSPIFP
jgi:hypothetical protein